MFEVRCRVMVRASVGFNYIRDSFPVVLRA